jgi:glutathione S-transferase
MLKIYGVTASRAFRTLWMANELGLEYENIGFHFKDGSTKSTEYLAINPNGRIPAIVDDGFALWESMAINLYLAKKYDMGFRPRTLEDEALILQWSFWVMTEVEKPALALLFHTLVLPEAERNPKIVDDSVRQLQSPFKVLDAALSKAGYLVGSGFTLADLNVASVLVWLKMARMDLGAFPKIKEWLDNALRRPAALKASGR